MKRLQTFLVLASLLATTAIFAQQQYTVDGKQYTLQTEVNGPITLLWTTINGEYRYFIKKDEKLTELKNTRVDGNYQEEYIDTLILERGDINIDVSKVKFTRPGLKKFVNAYNEKVDPNYTIETENIDLALRLGGFAGISNNAYFVNPDNAFLPAFGIDFEIIDNVKLKRHAILFQFTQLLSSSDYEFSSSELSLNYRFKFVMQPKFDVFVTAKGASYINVSRDIVVLDENDNEVTKSVSGGDFRTPGSFGLGADIALGKGYLTLAYNDIVAIGLEQGDEFPVNLTLGYKFAL